MSMRLSTAVRAGETLVPRAGRKNYFALTVDRGAMLADVTGCAYLGSYPHPEATKEKDRIFNLLRFGDGKIHTAAHGITRRLHAAFPELGKNIRGFGVLLKLSPVRPSKEQAKFMTLFGFLTMLFDDERQSVDDLASMLERAGL